MATSLFLRFDGISRPMELVDCPEVVDGFAKVFHGWQFRELKDSGPEAPAMVLRRETDGYHLEAPWLKIPIFRGDMTSAVCAFVAELFQAEIRDQPGLLLLHAAAVEIAGRLVVLPSQYKAGKTVLCACLAAHGMRLFTDDVLAIRAPDDYGFAPGTMPRLRLPLPQDLGPGVADFIDRHRGLTGPRYLYLDLGPEHLAERGTAAPIEGFVLLERHENCDPVLLPLKRSKILDSVYRQSFSRQKPGSDIMARLHRLIERAPGFRLRYARAEQAVELLEQAFAERKGGGAQTASAEALPHAAAAVPGLTYRRDPSVTEVRADGERFLARPDGEAIHQLNATGSAIWHLLEEPTTVADMTEALHAAFPDVPGAQIEDDVRILIAGLMAKGLVSD